MLGAGSVPDHRETGQGTVLGAGSVPHHRETGQGTVLGAGSVPHHRERDGAAHSARGPGRQGTMVHLPGHVGGEDPTSGERD